MNKKKTFKIIAAGLLLVMLIISSTAYAGDNIKPDAETGDPGVDEQRCSRSYRFCSKDIEIYFCNRRNSHCRTIILNGYKLASPNPNSRAEAMQGFMYTAMAGIVVFGAYYFAGVLKGIADTL